MRRNRRVASIGVVALVAAIFVVGAPPVGAGAAHQQSSTKPTATEVGVTATTIRIAVIADVNTPLAPGLFKAAADAVQAWGKYTNAHGGLAGRKVQVDFIDSKLSPDETRNAIIQACANDFAMVGTTALFLNNVDDMVSCKDQAGTATGLPDVPQLITDPTHARAPMSFPTLPPQVVQSDLSNTTYHVQIGQWKWYLKHVDKNLHGVFGTAADLKSTQTAGSSESRAPASLGSRRISSSIRTAPTPRTSTCRGPRPSRRTTRRSRTSTATTSPWRTCAKKRRSRG